jgi:hypothetical protein
MYKVIGVGNEFVLTQLTDYVLGKVQCSPASPSAILRAEKNRGTLNYDLVSRQGSRYQVLPMAVLKLIPAVQNRLKIESISGFAKSQNQS